MKEDCVRCSPDTNLLLQQELGQCVSNMASYFFKYRSYHFLLAACIYVKMKGAFGTLFIIDVICILSSYKLYA